MQTHNIQQGGTEWLQLRAKHFTASEAPAMLGLSKYKTRAALLREKALGVAEEVSASKQALFDRGHEAEAKARPEAEIVIGDDVFPATGTAEIAGLPLLASFDGITMDETVVWENKLWNTEFAAQVEQGIIPDTHWPQLEQQLLVSGAEKCYFTVSDGTPENTIGCWYRSQPERRAKLIAGWKLFAEDLANYQHVETAPAIVVAEPDALPALMVEITGAVTASNFVAWQSQIAERIRAINTDLDTDEDFAIAEKTVKFLGEGESELARCKERALAQTASIDELFRAIDSISAEMRAKRLNLEKLVKARKESIRAEIAQRGRTQVSWHLEQIAGRIGRNMMPDVPVDFGAAMKGKKTVTSLNEAVDTAFADWRLRADAIADVIEFNLNAYADLAAGYEFLFQDLKALVVQPATAFAAMVELRINKHAEDVRRQDEEKRAKIAAEERAKIEREQAEAERQRVAAEKAAEKAADDAASAKTIAPIIAAEIAARKAPEPDPAATLNTAMPDDGARITLGALCDVLGFTVTANFLAGLGFQAETDRSAKKYRACDFPRICFAIAEHVRKVAEQGGGALQEAA